MPKPKKPMQNGFVPTQFVRCDLTAEDKKDYGQFVQKQEKNLDTLVIEMLQANHKISFSFNGTTDSFICSVTGKPEDCDNASKCYTSYAKDYVTSLWVAVFKYHVIWKAQAWEEFASEADFG